MSSLPDFASQLGGITIAATNYVYSRSHATRQLSNEELLRELVCFVLGIAGAIAAVWIISLLRKWRAAGDTERARADTAIREAERRYQSIFDNAVEGIFQTSPDGRYIVVNSALARIYGYDSPEDLIEGLTDIGSQLYVSNETRAEFRRIMDECDVVSGFEAQIYRKDGSTAWISEHARAVRDDEGDLLYYEGTVEDITIKKTADDEIKYLNRTLELRLKRIAALRKIDIAISSSLDPRLAINVVLEQAVEQLGVEAASVWIHNQHTHELELFANKGLSGRSEFPKVRLGFGKLGEAAFDHTPIAPTPIAADEPIVPHAISLIGQGFRSYAGSPLVAKGLLRGWLEVYGKRDIPDDSEWLDYLVTLAGQAAIALDSTMMFRDLQRKAQELAVAYDLTIEGWSKALCLRDQETNGHSERVTEVTLRVAQEMGLPEASLVHIRRGALLHDIGKMAVPDSILLKPGALTDEEREIMYTHPARAYEMLSCIPYLRPALDIPYCHHEKWDGNGYPRGLRGEEIPLSARIFAVVDVWDALISDRPYRKGWPEEKVIQHINDLSGSHFDPYVVEIFMKVIRTGQDDELGVAA